MFISLLNFFKACLIFTSSRSSAELRCFDLRGMWVALSWYGLFVQAGMHKPSPSVAAIMGMRAGIFRPRVSQMYSELKD